MDAVERPHDAAERPRDAAVVAALVENHRAFLAFLERRVGDRAVAEDILQTAFTRSLERLDTLREGESAVAWFYRSLRNAVVDHWRRSGARSRAVEAFGAELDEGDEETTREVCRCVARLAETLKPEYAAALRRIEVDELAVRDFAAEAGISAGNAAVRVFRAREALRRQVVASCGTCAEHGCVDCTCGSAHHG